MFTRFHTPEQESYTIIVICRLTQKKPQRLFFFYIYLLDRCVASGYNITSSRKNFNHQGKRKDEMEKDERTEQKEN